MALICSLTWRADVAMSLVMLDVCPEGRLKCLLPFRQSLLEMMLILLDADSMLLGEPHWNRELGQAGRQSVLLGAGSYHEL